MHPTPRTGGRWPRRCTQPANYFPSSSKLCLNGHEYAKRQLAREGIPFEALDNGALQCADPERARRLRPRHTRAGVAGAVDQRGKVALKFGCLDRATSGTYRLDGEDVSSRDFDDLAEIRNRKIGFIFQMFNLIPVLDVAENIEFPCVVRRNPEPARQLRARVEALAEAVGLTPFIRHRPDELSGGQRQRVAIARALITEPRLVLADEPTANLDSETSEQILDLMLTLNRTQGVTFLFSTHDHRVVRHARRALAIQDGRMLPEDAAGGTGTRAG